jgi:GDP-4-dehydro-6-deoxy-D-mannose reductase
MWGALLVANGAAVAGDVYNVASGRAVAIQEILNRLLKLSTTRVSVVEDPARLRSSDTPVIVGDTTKLKEATGWQARYSLDQTLADILAAWRERTVSHIPGRA